LDLQGEHLVSLEALQAMDEYCPSLHTEQLLHALGDSLSVVRIISLYVSPLTHGTQLLVFVSRMNPALQSRGHPSHDLLNWTGCSQYAFELRALQAVHAAGNSAPGEYWPGTHRMHWLPLYPKPALHLLGQLLPLVEGPAHSE
jgi:hypothetical protein